MLVYLQMIEAPEERTKFESIYLLYRDMAFAVAYRILNNSQDAEDAVQYAFLKVVENISKISEPECIKTKAYIVTIVENRAIDIYRRKKARSAVPLNEAAQELWVAYDGDNALARCILKLPARQRHIIVLKYHYGYKLKEIAKMLGITYNNACTIEQRAKKRLKALCEEEGLL